MTSKHRTICHIDLDAFYCQVEHVRLNIPTEIPLAVQQWNGLIAINYACRAMGITRHCTVKDALEKCPNIKLVHVATYYQGDTQPEYHSHPTPTTHKVSLDVYRNASSKILKIMKRFCKTIERASVDEAYFDLTDVIDSEKPNQLHDINDDGMSKEDIGELIANETADFPNTSVDHNLYKAALIVRKVRQSVFDELGYTCSAGISVNKTLAKLCSSMFKPNKQSILRLENVERFMEKLPFQKIRNFGGKLGVQVQSELKLELAGEVSVLPIEYLKEKFGDNAEWIQNICKGICNDPVIVRETVQSMGACKSFRPFIESFNDLGHWISILASELYTRVMDDYEINKRWPKTMLIVYRNTREEKSKSFPFMNRDDLDSSNALTLKLSKILETMTDLIPCARLAVHLNVFQALSSTNILSYFKRVEKGNSWCKECGTEIVDKREHDDYHFALNLSMGVSEEEKKDRAFAESLQEDGHGLEIENSKRKKTKLTDYFVKK